MVDSFGDVLRQLRQDRGWSLRQLSEKVRWSHGVVGFIETGKQQPTPEFAAACDRVFGTTPILTTLCGLEGDDVRRRALVRGMALGMGLGAVGSVAAMADLIRLDTQDAAGIGEDWDARIVDLQRRFVVEPSPAFGQELLTSMLVTRQLIADRQDSDALRAGAHFSLLFGLYSGNNGDIDAGRNFFRTSAALAAHSGDKDTLVYVHARTAVGGPYQGLGVAQTRRSLDLALTLAGDQASLGALEAQAAAVQLAALTGDLQSGRAAIHRMWLIAERMAPTRSGPGPAQRTASFHAYLEGRLGSLGDAEKAWMQAEIVLAGIPQWLVEARLYYTMAMIRHGDVDQGLREALKAAQSLRYKVRVIRLAVNDLLTAVPADHRSPLIEQLREHAADGPQPQELILI